jgi:glycosyltransferase involved in cell wall biosynthesis
VIFTGGVSNADVPPYFWNADLFLLVSNVEAFGLPILEAMAAGVPVIVSNRSALPEIAGGAALLTSLEQRNHLAEQILRVLQDDKLSSGLRQLGDRRARSFDWTETAARALDLFNDAVGVSPHKQFHRKEATNVSGHRLVHENEFVREGHTQN